MHDSYHAALFVRAGLRQHAKRSQKKSGRHYTFQSHTISKYLVLLTISVLLALVLMPGAAHAQWGPSLSGRILSRDGRWIAPVSGGLLSSDEDDHLRRGSVYAWDISAAHGAFIFPMAAGTVSYAGCNNAGGYGCWALIDHEDGYVSLYAHMIDEGGGSIRVRTGDRVNVWTPLGRVGWTGMTSFGPHVHWEIHHTERGRVRNDLFFARSAITYCKFCAADSAGQQVVGVGYLGNLLLVRELSAALLLLALGITLFLRPQWAATGLHKTSLFVHRLLHRSQQVWQRSGQQRRVHWASIVLAFLIPAFVCSSGTALAVWMADEEIHPRTLWAYFRFGFYPFPGQGYQVGAHYSAVWGMPCHGVGTLGQGCQTDELVQATLDWQRAVGQFSQTDPIPVAIPRLEGRFGVKEARELLTSMHYNEGLAIIDVGSDFRLAYTVVDELTAFGLDGIAIDMEFLETVRRQDLYWLAERMAQRRRLANLQGKGVLVLWNVFHNIDDGDIAGARFTTDAEDQEKDVAAQSVLPTSDTLFEEIEIIPIFTGYGPTDTKIAGLLKTQELFLVEPPQAGLMAFDQRWPINERCRTFNTTLGFDCQDWRSLFSNPTAARAGWWVQQ